MTDKLQEVLHNLLRQYMPQGMIESIEENIRLQIVQDRATEREKILSVIEGWLVDVKEPKSGISDYADDFARHSVNEYCSVLRTRLNQLKGTE